MIKAIFIDYTSTIVQESGNEMKETVTRVCKNSTLRDPHTVMKEWWSTVKRFEDESYGEAYMTEDEIALKALQVFADKYELKDDLNELLELIRGFWVNAPIFPDVKEFFDKCPLPIYVISNNGMQYMEKAMKLKLLAPAGIVCADMVRAYKPHKELFQKALGISGCRGEETVHIGDSYQSDVIGAQSTGIKPILINRKGNDNIENISVINNLSEVLSLLHQ